MAVNYCVAFLSDASCSLGICVDFKAATKRDSLNKSQFISAVNCDCVAQLQLQVLQLFDINPSVTAAIYSSLSAQPYKIAQCYISA